VTYSKTLLTVRKKVLAALTYPAILIALSIVLVVVLLTYVLPNFQDFFSDFGAELPFHHAGRARGLEAAPELVVRSGSP